jgi:MinD superfamily P-loop ATPase
LIVSVASGKGGTGKTTVATNLAAALAAKGRDVAYLDCDVEEPNGHLFLKPRIDERQQVNVAVPRVDLNKCTFCGECSKTCQYNAIAVLLDKVMVFPSLCHSCGGCRWICPESAIEEVARPIGEISCGEGHGVAFCEGRLNVGEALSPPVTRALKKVARKAEIVVVDAPPGTSCPVIEAVNGSDFVVLVTEPTPFGLNDLVLAVGMTREIGLPFGVVINRADIGDGAVERYCNAENISVLLRIPFDRKIAEAYSQGDMASLVSSGYSETLCQLFETIYERVHGDGSSSSKR